MARNARLSEQRVSVGVSPRDMALLRLMAERDETSVSAVVRRILRDHLHPGATAAAPVERDAVAS